MFLVLLAHKVNNNSVSFSALYVFQTQPTLIVIFHGSFISTLFTEPSFVDITLKFLLSRVIIKGCNSSGLAGHILILPGNLSGFLMVSG